MSLTHTQEQAVIARGNVLVAAGAGTGKTRTLVERCLHCLLEEQPPVSIDEILVVTFTEAAAAEMRQRIRDRLELEKQQHPGDSRWPEQLALFEVARIGTLHSFCFQLVREHFYQLGLDPQVTVLPEDEARLLAEEMLDELFEGHYAGRDSRADAVQKLIQVQGRGWDKPIRGLVLKLHHYTQTLPNPTAWLQDQSALYSESEPSRWRTWLLQTIAEFPRRWLNRLESFATNKVAAECAGALRKLAPSPALENFNVAISQIGAARTNCPQGKKTLWLKPLKRFFAEVDFLGSLLQGDGGDPLSQDWAWVREHMGTLLELTREFSQSFSEAKRELGVLDFHDLEQHMLRLLWDNRTDQPTEIAWEWREKLRFIFVDEYQDINSAQDRIIEGLAGHEKEANRFLVGDIKQSIYRFRLANPSIFQKYAEEWPQVISLVDNFRAREGLLQFVNSVFGLLVTREFGGVDYAKGAALQFGDPRQRIQLSANANPAPATELHLLLKQSGESSENTEEAPEALNQITELLEAEKEARLVAIRLRELHEEQHPIWDEQTKQFRPVEWKDMAILLRSPANKSESYAKELARLKLPLQVARAGFYRSVEISDLVSLLQILDNPQQDVPLLAVLHSPLVGLDAKELVEIRLTALKSRFWNALLRWHELTLRATAEKGAADAEKQPSLPLVAAEVSTLRKVESFLKHFAEWRRLARQGSLARCLETVLAETYYDSWLLTQSNGGQRRANVQRLLGLAQEFDQFQRQGLFRFLKFIEAQQAAETEPEVAAIAVENSIRLMSIHQSKGLEFPVVVVADLGKGFNTSDLRGEIILDEQYGLCPRVKPPHTGKRYPSLAHWLGASNQMRELLGEELRLLYVAFTRARDTLVLTGSIAKSKWTKDWHTVRPVDERLAARSYTDWLGLWFAGQSPTADPEATSGQMSMLRWFVHDYSRLIVTEPKIAAASVQTDGAIDFSSEAWRKLEQRLNWRYPFATATEQPAKTSVSVLRRLATAEDEEMTVLFQHREPRLSSARVSARVKLSAAEIGTAHHQFLELFSLEETANVAALESEAKRLQELGRLNADQVRALDFDALAKFWTSDLGRRIRGRSELVRRELAFTARFAPNELPPKDDQPTQGLESGEFVLVQGVIDLAVISSKEIWLIDFKTDEFKADELPLRQAIYEPQIELYASALSRIYGRPVTEAWLHFFCHGQSVRVR